MANLAEGSIWKPICICKPKSQLANLACLPIWQSGTRPNLEAFLQSGDSRSLALWRYAQSGSNLAKNSIWPLQDKFSPSQSGDIINLASLAIKRQSGANVRRQPEYTL